MAQTLTPIHPPIAYVIKSTVDSSFVLLTANFTNLTVASSVLDAAAVAYLQNRLNDVIAKVPVKADIESGFAGLVEGLLTAVMFESGSFTVSASYSAPTATVTLGGLVNPCHVGISIPQSTSSPLIGLP